MRAGRQKELIAGTAALHEERERFRANRRTNNPVNKFRSPGIKVASLLCSEERKLKMNEVERHKIALTIAFAVALNALFERFSVESGLLHKPV